MRFKEESVRGLVALVTVAALALVAKGVWQGDPIKDAKAMSGKLVAQTGQLKLRNDVVSNARNALTEFVAIKGPGREHFARLEVLERAFADSIEARAIDAKALTALREQVEPLKDQLTTLAQEQPDLAVQAEAAKTTLDSKDQLAKAELDAIKPDADVVAAKAFVDFAERYFAALGKAVEPLSALADDADADKVRKAVAENLGATASAWDDAEAVKDQLKNTLAAAKRAVGEEEEIPDPLKAHDELVESIKAVAQKVPDWITKVVASAKEKNKELSEAVPATAHRDSGAVAKITKGYNEAKTFLDSLSAILVGGSRGERIWGAAAEREALTLEVTPLQVNAQLLLDYLQGDRTAHKTRRVSLSYFRDVPRLMKLLNPLSQLQAMGSQADMRSKNKSSALDILDITESVSALGTKQSALIQARAGLQSKEAAARDADGRADQYDKQVRDEKYAAMRRDNAIRDALAEKTAAETAMNEAGISDEVKEQRTEAYKRASKRHQDLVDSNAMADEKGKDLEADQTKAREKANSAKAEATSAAETVKTLAAEVDAAAMSLARARRSAIESAIDANNTFVSNLANEPYWYSVGVTSSGDPLRRVDIFGMPDSATIILRGAEADLDAAEDAIGEYDRPAPQAYLSVWSLQVNTVQDYSSRQDALSGAMFAVEDILSEAQRASGAVLSALQSAVFETVRTTTDDHLKSSEIPACISDEKSPGFRTRLASLMFFNDSVLASFGIDRETIRQATPLKDEDQKNLVDKLRMALKLAPDPARTTTLGEAVLVLVLASDTAKKSVYTKFNAAIDDLRGSLSKTAGKGMVNASKEAGWDNAFRLRRFWNRLGVNPDGSIRTQVSDTPLGVGQREIVQAIQRDGLSRLWKWLSQRRNLLDAAIKRYGVDAWSPAERATFDYNATFSDEDLAHLFETHTTVNISRSLADYVIDLQSYFDLFYRAFGYLPDASEKGMGSNELNLIKSLGENLRNMDSTAFVKDFHTGQSKVADQQSETTLGILLSVRVARFIEGLSGFRLAFSRKDTNARVSAADQQLKEYIQDIQDDVDAAVIRPQTYAIRDTFRQKNLQVGILQRTGILGADRHASRVDVGATAAVDLGKKRDILEAAQQALALYNTAQGTNLLGLVGGLKSKPEPAPELYAIGTGGVFQVTPIFEASGQAVRFDFDYVPTVIVRDPNGTTNANLPRVEKYTVHTEGQLSNLELRKISEFQANSQLGVPPKKWGGIPILNDIPFLKELPIIGWFSRREGKSAASHFSLLLGSSVTYPTIGDMVNLLGNQPPVVVEEKEAP